MDASAYLKSHGWRGLGYSLDHKDRGLKRPLLVSQKQDVLGVGKQRHNNAHADQWWMRAFDESLKQIGTGQKTTLGSIREHGIDKGSLYGCFVQGRSLEGTISYSTVQSSEKMAADMPAPAAIPNPAPAAGDAKPKAAIPTAVEVLAKASRDFELDGLIEVKPVEPTLKRKKGKEPRAEGRKRRKIAKEEKARENDKKLAHEIHSEIAAPSVKYGATQQEVDAHKAEERRMKEVRKAKRAKEEVEGLRKTPEKEEKAAAKRARKERRKEKERIASGIAEMKAKQAAKLAGAGAVKDSPPLMDDAQEEASVRLSLEVNGSDNLGTDADFFSPTEQSEPASNPPIFNGEANPEKMTANNNTAVPVSRGEGMDASTTNGASSPLGSGAGEDVIKPCLAKKGRIKKIPGVGPVERYPTKAEKRQKKLESSAFAAGLTLEEYKARIGREKWEAEAPERERVAQVHASHGGMTVRECRKAVAAKRDTAANAIYLATGKYPLPGTYDAAEVFKAADLSNWQPKNVNWADQDAAAENAIQIDHGDMAKVDLIDLNAISDKKRRQYVQKAAAKGVSVEAYIAKRNGKKFQATGQAAKNQPGSSVVALADASLGFVVDTQGDPSLGPGAATPAFVVDAIGNEALRDGTTGGKPLLRWHPDLLGDRKTEDLSEEERAARLEWMHARRAAKHAAAAAATGPMSKMERRKRKEKKRKLTL